MGALRTYLKRIPGLHPLYRSVQLARSPFLRFVPPGHYYSCVPDLQDVLARAEVIFRRDVRECPGIDLREAAQLELLDRLAPCARDLDFSRTRDATTRYYYENGQFGIGDALVLASLLRCFRPRRVVEVGSGFSSAAMLDVNDLV